MIATWPVNLCDCRLLVDFNIMFRHANIVTNIVHVMASKELFSNGSHIGQ